MNKFGEFEYTRPDYKQVKENLAKFKGRISGASSYEDIRQLWISMKESMQYLDYVEEIAYIRYLCGVTYDFYKEEVCNQDVEGPQIAALQNECDKLLLNSSYSKEFRQEFGDKIVDLLSNNIMLSDAETNSLKAEESRLRTEYIGLLSSKQRTGYFEDKLYEVFDCLIKVRTEIARTLGFRNYIEMAYKIHGRVDYGESDIAAFRSQIRKLMTPVCNELRKSTAIKYPDTVIKTADDMISVIKDMFNDISSESGEYINDVLGHELYDIADRPNKRQNFYSCCMLPYFKMPYIIGCFHGNGLEANYLIHEFGHGFAFYTAACNQRLYEYHRAVTSVNEIHSKSMEHFA
jgi:hypothetical protein